MKEYLTEISMKDEDVLTFSSQHETDADALAQLDKAMNVLQNSDKFKNAIEYYELYRLEDDKRVVIDENFFV
jgi:hypothetical protein